MPEPLLRAEGLSLRCGGAPELASVSFSVEASSLTALVGPDAWDKDALVDVLRGFRPPSQGTLRLAGRPITTLPPAVRARRGLVWTTRPPLELVTDTLVEAVVMAMTATRAVSPLDFFRRRPSDAISSLAVELLQFVGLGGQSGASPGRLEPADRARLELARALAARPRVLLVDRLSELIPSARRPAFANLLRHITQTGRSVLWIEDDAMLACATTEHVIGLCHGRSLVAGAIGTKASRAALEAAFLGQTR